MSINVKDIRVGDVIHMNNAPEAGLYHVKSRDEIVRLPNRKTRRKLAKDAKR